MGMNVRYVALGIVVVLYFMGQAEPLQGQQAGSAAATPVTRSLGGPSPLDLRMQSIITLKAELQRQLRQVQRCIDQATPNLRGPGGTVNRVASTDLVNCSRELDVIKADLVNLGRDADYLAQEAQALAQRLQTIALQTEVKKRIDSMTSPPQAVIVPIRRAP